MSARGKPWSSKRRAALLVAGLGAVWFLAISGLHYWLNFEREGRLVVKMGYMPVITNLACPLLDRATVGDRTVHFHAIKFSSFAEMGEALRNGQLEVGFMIAPLSIVLRQQGADVKLVYIGNRHESTLVVKRDSGISSLRQLAGKTVAVPIRFSGHNLCLLQALEKEGLEKQVKIVEMNPPDMAAAMLAGALDAYFVGEPFAARSVTSGHAKVLSYVEELWPGFICNVMVVRNDLVRSRPDVVQLLVEGAARSGLWASRNPREAARLAAEYWNQPPELIEYAMSTPPGRVDFQSFVPKEAEMQRLAELMVHFGLLGSKDLTGLLDDRFARQADLSGIGGFETILRFRERNGLGDGPLEATVSLPGRKLPPR